MISIDGSTGEGGGQIFRSALSLSALTQTPIRISKIRGKRRKDGLLRQHLTALRAMKEICNAKVTGDTIRSTEVFFEPGKIKGGDYAFEIGTAGSTSLVLQTLLWPLFFADRASRVEISGGTHNPMSPPFEFLKGAFLPAISELGFKAELELQAYGFAPAGGGKIVASIAPVTALETQHFDHTIDAKGILFTIIGQGLPKHVAFNEKKVFEESMPGYQKEVRILNVHSQGSGNVVLAEIKNSPFPFIAVEFGQRGNAAEKIARKLVNAVEKQIEKGQPVGPHLADQLIIPFALAKGGSFQTNALTPHTLTQIKLVKLFTKINIDIEKKSKKEVHLHFS